MQHLDRRNLSTAPGLLSLKGKLAIGVVLCTLTESQFSTANRGRIAQVSSTLLGMANIFCSRHGLPAMKRSSELNDRDHGNRLKVGSSLQTFVKVCVFDKFSYLGVKKLLSG